ncbi:hypothetical protein AA0229_0901 [Gluconobacter cerinus NRIC 0229]|nr:hypothetical protein AA0229_0901 [Gluconobacter cerinus NRIC 0229]
MPGNSGNLASVPLLSQTNQNINGCQPGSNQSNVIIKANAGIKIILPR